MLLHQCAQDRHRFTAVRAIGQHWREQGEGDAKRGLEPELCAESSTNLVNWTATGPQFTAESETIVSEFDVDVTGRFFQIREVP